MNQRLVKMQWSSVSPSASTSNSTATTSSLSSHRQRYRQMDQGQGQGYFKRAGLPIVSSPVVIMHAKYNHNSNGNNHSNNNNNNSNHNHSNNIGNNHSHNNTRNKYHQQHQHPHHVMTSSSITTTTATTTITLKVLFYQRDRYRRFVHLEDTMDTFRDMLHTLTSTHPMSPPPSPTHSNTQSQPPPAATTSFSNIPSPPSPVVDWIVGTLTHSEDASDPCDVIQVLPLIIYPTSHDLFVNLLQVFLLARLSFLYKSYNRLCF